MASGILRTPANAPAATSSSATGVEPNRMPTAPQTIGEAITQRKWQTSICATVMVIPAWRIFRCRVWLSLTLSKRPS